MVFLQYLYYALSMISSRSLFLMMMMMNLVFAGPTTGLTLKLIHRDSLYPRNLTKLERMERAFQQLIHREQRLISTWHQMKQQQEQRLSSRNNSSTTTNNSKSDMDTLRPEVKIWDLNNYMVELGIGTFASKGGKPSYYYFYFDTGSDLLWLQCDATRTGTTKTEYFKQDAEIYNHGEYSLTYNPLPYNSPNHICKKYVGLEVPPEGTGKNFCGYRIRYLDGGSTEGVLATEKLTVRADNGGTEETINDFVFGCGYRQVEPQFGQSDEKGNQIVGILGLGGGEESFISQLGDRVDKKFEYCFKPTLEGDHSDTPTYLRFGSDTKIVQGGQGVQTTNAVPMRGDTMYYAIMEAILIDGTQVVYPEGSNVFATKSDGSGGCIFDSGTELTILSSQVFVPLRDQLVNYFNVTHGIRRRSPKGELAEWDLCFQGPVGFDKFPTITFRFVGGDFEMEPDALFTSEGPMFCLTIVRCKLRNSFSVVLGALHQVNHRILHDNGARTISWINNQDCAKDP